MDCNMVQKVTFNWTDVEYVDSFRWIEYYVRLHQSYIYMCVHSVKVYIGRVTAALANGQIKQSIEQKPIHTV